jgi:hypothetical protein
MCMIQSSSTEQLLNTATVYACISVVVDAVAVDTLLVVYSGALTCCSYTRQLHATLPLLNHETTA